MVAVVWFTAFDKEHHSAQQTHNNRYLLDTMLLRDMIDVHFFRAINEHLTPQHFVKNGWL